MLKIVLVKREVPVPSGCIIIDDDSLPCSPVAANLHCSINQSRDQRSPSQPHLATGYATLSQVSSRASSLHAAKKELFLRARHIGMFGRILPGLVCELKMAFSGLACALWCARIWCTLRHRPLATEQLQRFLADVTCSGMRCLKI